MADLPSATADFLASADFLRSQGAEGVAAGVFFGPGAESTASVLMEPSRLKASAVRGWPSEQGLRDAEILVGRLGSVQVMAWRDSRLPGEGVTARTLGHGVRVLRELGADTVILLESCRALNPSWRVGDLALITDHINLQGDNPLVGPDVEEHGVRFPDMTFVYDEELRRLVGKACLDSRVLLREGVYAGVLDAVRLTPAESLMLGRLGADMAGQAIIPRAIVARHADLRVLGLASVRCDSLPLMKAGGSVEAGGAAEAPASAAAPDVRCSWRELLPRIAELCTSLT